MASFEMRDLLPAFGTEIEGLTSVDQLDADVCAQLLATFDDRGLLLFRDVTGDRMFQTYLVRLLSGEQDLSAEALAATAERHRNFYISNRMEKAAAPFGRLLFHADAMYTFPSFWALSLHAEHVEPPVVPTTFTSGIHCWNTLPDDLRARAEGLHVLQVNGQVRRTDDHDDSLIAAHDHEISMVTPIGWPHPRTGRTILYVSEQNTREVVELPAAEGEQLLKDLFAHQSAPEHVYSLEWRDGDLAVWDNYALQHGRPDVKEAGPVRTLRKAAWPMPEALANIKVDYDRS
jgi:alpha-ketoglutarate-dependent taurine dioxygenase